MLQTIFSAYPALLFPVLLSWIRGRADVQSLKALDRKDKRCLWFLMRNPQWAEPSADVVRVKELRDRKGDCLLRRLCRRGFLTQHPL